MRPPSCLLGSSCTADPSPGGECGSAWAVTPCCILPLSSSSTTAASLCPSVSTLYLHAPANWLCIYLPGSQPRREEKEERRVPLYRSRPSSVYPAGRLRKFALSRQTGAPSSSSGLSGSAGRAGPGRGKVTSPYGSSLPPARPSVATPPAPLPRGPTYARGSPPSSAASAISRPCPRPAPLPAPEKQAAAAAAQ